MIDGDVITSKQIDKCDYLVLNDDKQTAYLIELKGSDFSHAVLQLKQTKKELCSDIKGYKTFMRIVFSGNATHSINKSEYLKWQMKHGKINGIYVAQMKRSELKEAI